MVASGARGDTETIDVSVVYEPASPRGGATVGSGQPVWCAPDRWDVSRHPEATRGVVDVRAGGRGGTDEQYGGGAIRPDILWRKGSFGTQSAEGSRFVESMMTVVARLKQQQRHVLEYLTTACEAALRGEAAPSLLPESEQKAHAAA